MTERSEAVAELEGMEHVLAEQQAAEIAAAAAFDQASAHLAEVHGRVVVAQEQIRTARTRVACAFDLPGAFMFKMLDDARAEAMQRDVSPSA